MSYTDFRLKLRRWVRKYRRLIMIIFIIWLGIFLLNLYFTLRTVKPEASTTYKAHTSIIDNDSSTPATLREPIEDLIKKYVDYCNDGNYRAAYDLLSEDCKKYQFNDDIDKFMKHVYTKMPTQKQYSIQSYSNITYEKTKIYIYDVKYTDDLLATGLTNSTYTYTSEKMSFYRDKDDDLQMNIGDYILYDDVKRISENEYLKADVISKVVSYKTEKYTVKLTNRSNYKIVISDGVENEEIVLTLPNEIRNRLITSNIVLNPNETMTYEFEFPKFIDDGDTSQGILFSSVRVMEKYSGAGEDIPEEVIQSEVDNAISKFSMTVGL